MQVSAGQTYVAGYYAPNGHYAANGGYFASSGVRQLAAAALQDGADGGNGVYAYGSDQFPTNTYNGSPTTGWTRSSGPPSRRTHRARRVGDEPGQWPDQCAHQRGVSFTFNKAVQPSTIQFTLTGPGGTRCPAPSPTIPRPTQPRSPRRRSLSSATTYTATVSGAEDSDGLAMSGPYSWTFTTAQATPPPGQCPCSIWPDSTQPRGFGERPEPGQLGVKFTTRSKRVDHRNPFLQGPRQHRDPRRRSVGCQRQPARPGDLHERDRRRVAAGKLLAPIQVTAGTTYVASYFAPDGGESATSAGFASVGADNAPLHAPASSTVTGGNGVYVYSGSLGFPTSTFGATNYWVDVVFTPTAP